MQRIDLDSNREEDRSIMSKFAEWLDNMASKNAKIIRQDAISKVLRGAGCKDVEGFVISHKKEIHDHGFDLFVECLQHHPGDQRTTEQEMTLQRRR